MSIIITIISNITVCHVVNKKAPPIVSPNPLLYQVFTRFVCCFTRNTFSESHHYAQLGNALQKNLIAHSALIIDTLKGSISQIFNFSAQSQNFTRGFDWT